MRSNWAKYTDRLELFWAVVHHVHSGIDERSKKILLFLVPAFHYGDTHSDLHRSDKLRGGMPFFLAGRVHSPAHLCIPVDAWLWSSASAAKWLAGCLRTVGRRSPYARPQPKRLSFSIFSHNWNGTRWAPSSCTENLPSDMLATSQVRDMCHTCHKLWKCVWTRCPV